MRGMCKVDGAERHLWRVTTPAGSGQAAVILIMQK